ncbi:hypothetical protein VTL71DRAFT_2852 [Oculimacula yallundae]|uniref:Uncharacterized protein n=1 Tax=Oculimacula yallundae TaxID=86028 RepID=A0ABR4CA09_9HELO
MTSFATMREWIGVKVAVVFHGKLTRANLLAIPVASHLLPREDNIAAEPGHIVGKSAFDRSPLFAYQPKANMIFISNPTEVGTVYTKSELDVGSTCKDTGLLLLMVLLVFGLP